MKLCSVTVWYNPNESCIQNIFSYNCFVEKCFIVDNSKSDNSFMATKIRNAVYIPLHDNLGIAKALNIGCERAMEAGFEWCMTMDQDSSWKDSELKTYFQLISHNVSAKNISFSARYNSPEFRSVLSTVKQALLKISRKNLSKEISPVENTDRTLCSGNVISLKVWNDVGRFFEPFFIDEVDHEFCYRLKEHGYNILIFNTVHITHVMGTPKRTFYSCITFHQGKRIYYIFRNMSYMKNLHPLYYQKCHYEWALSHRKKELLFNLRLKDIPLALKGIRDAQKEKLGKYEDLHNEK